MNQTLVCHPLPQKRISSLMFVPNLDRLSPPFHSLCDYAVSTCATEYLVRTGFCVQGVYSCLFWSHPKKPGNSTGDVTNKRIPRTKTTHSLCCIMQHMKIMLHCKHRPRGDDYMIELGQTMQYNNQFQFLSFSCSFQ